MQNINIKETVNLPFTDFPLRASLAVKEPELLNYWQEHNLYEQILLKQKDYSKSYFLHDGPPYPNGDIHMGHALNKVLKDIVVRSKVMAGYKSSFLPGWDCHGLPIEVQVIKELKKNDLEHKKHDIAWFREKCKDFSLKYVETQKKEFKRLGIIGEWDNPYLTLNKNYEAKVLELFGKMAQNGLVHKGLKPIHWCSTCQTALAEAEIEYNDHRSPSIYVAFKVTGASAKLAEIIKNLEANIMVWTTTPWTLPANVAIAAHPEFNYLVAKTDDKAIVFVEDLKEKIQKELGLSELTILGSLSGKKLAGTKTEHPFIERTSEIINAVYVTKEDGTGFVHIAPGHGQEDYLVGLEYDLPIIMPVDEKGRFTEEVEWEGLKVFDANKPICEKMKEKGTLWHLNFVSHAYPHCWRCKKPVIFRATEQWFIFMDKPFPDSQDQTLREKSLAEIKKVKWHPSWGENRIYSMIENRPDWCISRQRYWGIPIPVFHCNKCDHIEMTGEFNKAVVELVKKEGALAWFSKDVDDILPKHLTCSKCNSRDFTKEKDIMDVWFESGASFGAALDDHPELNSPANLYLEGSDQHRGWFQSSLLIGTGTTNQAPYKEVLTHGFIVDEHGKKMSKSIGNVISPQKIVQEHGADTLRWWIANTDFKNDINISQNVLKQARDSFTKVRNTIRFCLGNLNDFDPQKDLLEYQDLSELDKWALSQLHNLITKCSNAYASFELHLLTHSVHDFCAVTLSSLYLDMIKDRLYCDYKESKQRRSSQTVLYLLVDALIKLIAPILVFTSEDVYKFFNKPDKKTSIHLEDLPKAKEEWLSIDAKKWQLLINIKDQCYQKLESLRSQKIIGSFLEAQVDLVLDQEIDFEDWESLLIISQANISTGKELKIEVSKSKEEKCDRCWKRLPLKNGICTRCQEAIANSN
ncbi:isoleucine--tRNA ligase [Candidatus Margulisiibacteriota bacterium]